jgi:hypothetical protein
MIAIQASLILSPKQLEQKSAGGVAQVVEHLPSKCKDLSSNSSIARIIKKWEKGALPFLQEALCY